MNNQEYSPINTAINSGFFVDFEKPKHNNKMQDVKNHIRFGSRKSLVDSDDLSEDEYTNEIE